MSQNSEDYILKTLSEKSQGIVKKILAAIDEMDYVKATALIQSLSEHNEAAALYYSSCFSHSEESLEDFEERHIIQLSKACELGYPPAIHKLAVCYDVGDPIVERDTEKAARLFQSAAQKGHPHSQWIHGNDLLHGTNGISKDVKLGLEYIEKSFASNFEGAMESLAEFYRDGKYGYPIDPRKSEEIYKRISRGNILTY